MASDVVDTVARVLEELQPENIDRSAVTVTGEGAAVEIVIVPHRDLGGVSLVLWTDGSGTQILWAAIGDLSTHDDIDLGTRVARIPHEGAWEARLRDAFTSELNRLIRLKHRRGVLGKLRVDCYLAFEHKERRLAVLRPGSPFDPAPPESVTTLASGPRLYFSITPPIENWRQRR